MKRKFLMNRAGFSIVEILIVTAIIGVTSAITIPNLLSHIPKWRANGVARDVVAKMMMARLKAIQNNREYGVYFTTGSIDRFKIQKNAGTSSSPNWEDEVYSSEAPEDINITLSNAVYCDTDRVKFNPDGTAACDSLEIETRDEVYRRKITINTSTGKITLKFCESEVC